eukprot:scaffold417344_cov14-Prasinocladus_malaysianus.AAC.1
MSRVAALPRCRPGLAGGLVPGDGTQNTRAGTRTRMGSFCEISYEFRSPPALTYGTLEKRVPYRYEVAYKYS